MINSVVLTGRIVADPELRHTPSNVSGVSFTLAVGKRFRPQNGGSDADFIDCVAWRQQAEFISNYVRKGNLLCVKGSLSTRTYTAQDGSNRKAYEVVVDDVQNCTSSPRDGQQASAQQVPPPDPFADPGENSAGSGYAPYPGDKTTDKDPDFDPFADD